MGSRIKRKKGFLRVLSLIRFPSLSDSSNYKIIFHYEQTEERKREQETEREKDCWNPMARKSHAFKISKSIALKCDYRKWRYILRSIPFSLLLLYRNIFIFFLRSFWFLFWENWCWSFPPKQNTINNSTQFICALYTRLHRWECVCVLFAVRILSIVDITEFAQNKLQKKAQGICHKSN